jgi:hypothetical protein
VAAVEEVDSSAAVAVAAADADEEAAEQNWMAAGRTLSRLIKARCQFVYAKKLFTFHLLEKVES